MFGRTPVISAPSAADKVFLCLPPNSYRCFRVEDQDGQIITGKEAVTDLKAEWQQGGFPIPAQSTMRNAFHLILSMPTRTDLLAVQRAARAFATREFSNHQYAYVIRSQWRTNQKREAVP
ncbi:MAG: hypothetical protein ACSLFJ_10545, partial [Immundisolibacter sp.]